MISEIIVSNYCFINLYNEHSIFLEILAVFLHVYFIVVRLKIHKKVYILNVKKLYLYNSVTYFM